MSIVLDITTLTNGGSGLGHLDGKAVFVADTVPGDRVRCRLIEEKKRYAKAQLLEVLTPSAQRGVAPCRHAGECGGCDWQMLSYEEQCRWKERLFAENFRHQLPESFARLKPLLVSPQPFGYRSRVQFKCAMNGSRFMLGFYRRGSHRVVDVTDCPVLDPVINRLIPQLRELFSGSCYAGDVAQIDVAAGCDGMARTVVHFQGRKPQLFRQWLSKSAPRLNSALLVRTSDSAPLQLLQGEEDLEITVGCGPLRLRYAAGGFAQINLRQNCALVDLVVEAAAAGKQDTVLDLYCGMGNFSLPLAQQAGQVIGVEGHALSIQSAKVNALNNGIKNADFYAQPVAEFLARCTRPAQIVVLDPPRSGAREALLPLLKCQPRRIVYISCDQQTLLRDLKILMENGCQLVTVQPVDMFPQTAHTEIVAVLDYFRS